MTQEEYLRDQNDIGSSRHTGIQSKISYFMSHYFHNKGSAMGGSCCMDTVNCLRCNIDGALETKGHVGTPKIIIYCFRKGDYI